MLKVLLLSLFLLTGCGVQDIPKSNNEVEAAWAEVQNQFQRRADLIPNLVETVKGYAKHEEETLTAVVEARSKATSVTVDPTKLNEETLKNFSMAQGELTKALSKLMVVVEKYPDLKANENFKGLQVQLEGTENRIGIARRRYIEAIQTFNNLVTVFPTNITNSIFFKFEKKPQFTANEGASETPKVSF